jgi:hypothetical protein
MLVASWAGYKARADSGHPAATEEEEEYVVEVIYGERIRKGVRQFHVKWQGYPSSDDDTWEPEENLANCAGKLQAFKAAAKTKVQSPVAPKKVVPTRPCSKCKEPVRLARASQATGADTTREFLCAPCQKKARTVCCADCKQDFLLPRASRATGAGTRKFFCTACKKKARTVSCARCNEDVQLSRASRATSAGTGHFFCAACKEEAPCRESVCPVCGDCTAVGVKYQARYSRYEACAGCKQASGVEVIGGDLLKLAQASPASIVGAGRLARYAHELKSGNQLTDGHYEALLERAHTAIQQHMHVRDEEKVALADQFETAMQYKGHCCAVCGIRDVELDYTEVYFDRSGNKSTGTVNTAAGLRVSSKKRAVQLRALPDWLHVKSTRVTELQEIKRMVYVEHDDAPGQFVRTEISALDMRHIMRVQNGYVHLIEEAVDVSPDDVALMFVCAHCVTALPSASTRKQKRATTSSTAADSATTAVANSTATSAPAVPDSNVVDDDIGTARKDPRPVDSMAKHDYGRRYLSAAAVDRLRLELQRTADATTEEVDTLMAERLLALPPCGWRLPVASKLETMLVAKAYLHIMSLKIAEATGGCVSRHATMKKHTIYFPLALLDVDNRRHCEPWSNTQDAVDALKIAVRRIKLVFVGSDGKFDRFKRAALTMQQMQLRPKVVFTLLMMQSMALQEQAAKTGATPGVTVLELAKLEEALSENQLSELITPESVSEPPASTVQTAPTGDQDIAHVRTDRGCKKSGSNRTDGGSSCAGQRRALPHESETDIEEEPIAGCADVSNVARDVMLGVTRLLQRGSDKLDDYGGQPQALYDAHFPLFPIQEGLELGKKLSVHKTRHMSLFYDGRFAHDLSLIFGLADTLSRHAVNKAVFVQALNTPHAQKKIEELMKDSQLSDRLRRACLDPRGEEAVALLHDIMPFVNMSCRKTPYTNGSRAAFLGTLLAHHRSMGPSCRALFTLPAPCCVYHIHYRAALTQRR